MMLRDEFLGGCFFAGLFWRRLFRGGFRHGFHLGFGGGHFLAGSLLFGRSLAIQSSSAIWTVIFLAIVPTMGAFSIQLWAQKLVSPLRTSLIFSLEPLFGAVFAWTLGQEPFSLMQAVGGLMIVAAIIVYNLTSQQT